MNKFKKLLLFLFLLIISSLTINSVKADTNKVEVTDVSVKEKSGTITVVDPVFVSNEIRSNITFNQKDDFVTFELTLKNNSDEKYKVVSLEDNNTNNNITLEYTHDDNYISKDETTKVTIKIKYTNQLVNVDTISLNNLTIKINLVSEDGGSSDIIINPVTGDHLIHYLVLLIISLTGLVFAITKKKFKGFKVGSILLVLGLVMAPFVVFAYETYDVSIKFTDIDIKGKFETYNITIDSKDGSEPIVKQITYGNKLGDLPSDPSKDGYSFEKWVDQNGSTVTSETIITGLITVSAKYNLVNYDISYNLNDGSLPQGKTNPTTYNIESDSITLENPTKTGYTFSGWTGTELDGLTTSVTIPTGSKGERSYTANYSPNQATKYTVIHKYQNYDLTTYTDDKEELIGATDTNVTPEFKPLHGFNNPASTQTVKIKGDESTEVIYIYTRKSFSFTITDRTYIDENVSAQNDNYLYETPLTIKAINRDGYTFEWSDGNSNLERTFNLNDNMSLTPVYTANTNTPYKVKHYKANLNGGYTLTDEQNLEGTTDTPVTPANNEYTGFVKPGTQTVNIDGDGETLVEYYYEREEYSFEITDRTYIDETVTTPNDDYPYETEVTLKALDRQGYTFKWSDNETTNPRTITMTGDVSLTPVYTANTNTPYTVKHYKANLNGGYTLADTDNLEGTTDTPVTPSTKNYTGFTKPATITTTIKGDGSTVVEYYYGRVSFSLTVNDSEYIQEGDLSDNYPYETQVTLTAIDRTHYTFTKWSNNETNNPITLTITEDITIAPVYTKNQYTITFNANGGTIEGSNIYVIDGGDSLESLPTVTPPTGKVLEGWYNEADVKIDANYVPTKTEQITARYEDIIATSYTVSFDTDEGTSVSDIVVPIGDSISALPTTAKENNIFLGWFESTTSDTPVTVPYTPTSDITLIAKWDKLICKKATTLHTEICNQSGNSKYCTGAGHSTGDTITYGNIVSSDTFTSGDALDCDVDGTGYNQRFYYLRTIDDRAVLISNKNHINYTPEGGLDPQDENGIYSWAFDQLPTTSEWSELPILFDGRPTRLITVPDLFAMTGTSSPSDLSDNWSLGNYEFLFENSNYSGVHDRSTQWVEEYEYVDPTTQEASLKRYRYRNDSGNLVAVESGKENTSKNPVRPVIEVPLRLIEDAYIVRFDSNDGETPTQYAYVKKGSSIGTLPTATKTGKEFGGWYTSLEYTTKISENTVPISYATYYAKWVGNVTSATLEYDSFILKIGEEDDIVITNLSDIEPVIFESTDEDIVTVDENGHLVGVGDGHTLVTITGTLSGAFITVDVTVSEEITDFTVTFDSMGGTDVDSMTVPKNTALGSLPSPDPTKADNDFAGWFTNTDYNVQVTVDTIIKSNVIFYAKWIPSDAVAEMDGTYYSTLQAAVDAAPTAKTTIKLIKNVAVTSPIDMFNKNTNKDIVLDLNGYTLSTASGAAAKTNVIKTKAKLEVKNGTISSAKNDALIDVEGSNSYLVLRENVTLIGTGNRACVYNYGGNVLIDGNASLTSNALWESGTDEYKRRGTVQTLSNGNTVIKAGTIINNGTSSSYGVSVKTGTVTIGTKDGLYDTENLIIQGETSGIYADVNFSLYDGLVKGKTAAVNNESKIIDTEDNMDKVNDEVDGYKRLYYQGNPSTFIITLNSNGGIGAPSFISVDEGDSVSASDITEPTKGIYTFTGWYYDENLQNPVTFPFTPSANMPLYAGWSYTPDPTPVSFNMTNAVMTNYFNNINTWKTQYEVTGTKPAKDLPDGSSYNEVVDSSEFEATMKANFDAYNCSACGTSAGQNSCSSPLAGDYCERPKGYNTGLSENINVYEYDATNDTSTLVTYTTSTNGIIYNMIPGKTYKWESTSDNNIYGFVEVSAVSGRRTIYSNVRNVRDLGGMEVSFTRGNTTKTGTIKYGKLYRGAQLTGGQSDVNSLTKLGITREVDLRSDDEQTPSPVRLTKYDKCDVNCSPINSSDDIIIKNYIIYPEKYSDNYANLRDAMKYVMQSVVDGDNIYFHCTIGTDRTGTIAYFLEGLLGVSEEDRIEDYELTYFYGLLNRTRFHDELSGSSIKPRFLSMNKTYDTNEKIYNFYMHGLTDEQIAEENVLIEQFRDAMIDYNN